MTPEDIEKEWQYRYTEALALGRNEARAKSEADEWMQSLVQIGAEKYKANVHKAIPRNWQADEFDSDAAKRKVTEDK